MVQSPRLRALALMAVLGMSGALLPVAADSGAAAVAGAPIVAEHVMDEVVVAFNGGVSGGDETAALDRSRVDHLFVEHAGRAQVFKVRPGQTVENALAALRAQPGVRYAEPNYLYHQDTVPNDPRFGDQWGYENTGQTVNGTTGTADADIDAAAAWDLTKGAGFVVVAVVDTGIAYDHPDLAANIWTNPGETGNGRENNHVDDDGNGYVDDWRGWDFVGADRSFSGDFDNDPRDINGHGTHVAGTIGAIGDNGIGVTGVAWNVRLMPLRVFDGEGITTSAHMAQAFTYAGNMGARVVNFSGSSSANSTAVSDAIAAHPNTLYVVAAGNSNLDLDGSTNGQPNEVYPCELPYTNVVCVAATTQSDARASFSNYSANSVDLGAPGVNILSTYPAFEAPVLNETFETDPFGGSPRWTKGAAAGSVNTWDRNSTYTPGSGAFSVTDSPNASYPNNSDTWIQTAAPVSLAGHNGCRLLYPMWVDTELGKDFFFVYVSTNGGASWTALRSWNGTGGVNDTIDISRFDGMSLLLRLELRSDASNANGAAYDGVYIDDIQLTCISTNYSGGGASNLAYLSGTSMATPHVAGAAALLVAYAPAITVGALRTALITTGDPLPALAGATVSGRRLNVAAALNSIASAPDNTPPTITVTSPQANATFFQGQVVNAAYSCSDTGGSRLATCNGTVANGAAIDTATLGPKTFTVNATDGAGNLNVTNVPYTVVEMPQGFQPLTPERLVDTRQSVRVGAGGQLDVVVLGRGGVPSSGVGAVVLNVTATDALASGYVTVWPGGVARPTASSLNFEAGRPVANVVVAKVGVGGVVSLWNANDSPAMGSVNLLVDVVGWFPA